MLKVNCPRCRKEVFWETGQFRPFCSKRCRELDLLGWSTEEYRLESEESSDDQEEMSDRGE